LVWAWAWKIVRWEWKIVGNVKRWTTWGRRRRFYFYITGMTRITPRSFLGTTRFLANIKIEWVPTARVIHRCHDVS
tara:strand:+ start:276 stop:503 length:228 start_codon:yes stop_codon:yes gene_type:complete